MGVTVPRITLRADYGEDNSFGELNLLSVGYGMHQAWVYSAVFAPQILFGKSSHVLAVADVSNPMPVMVFVSMVVYCIALLFQGATDQRFLKVYTSRRFMGAGALLAFAGTLCAISPVDLMATEATAGVLTGIGSSILLIGWGTQFARCDSLSIVLNTGVAMLLSVAIYAFALHCVPVPASGLLVALLPLGEFAVLRKKAPVPFYERGEVPVFNPLPLNKPAFVLAFSSPIFVFGLALGILRGIALQVIAPAAGGSGDLLMLIAAGCAAVLVVVTVVALGGAGSWTRLFRAIVPMVAIAALFIPSSLSAGSVQWDSALLMIAYLCFEALMWVYFGEMSQRFRLSPIFVFGLGRGALALSLMIGNLSPAIAPLQAMLDSLGDAGTAVVMLIVVAVGYALLPSEHGMQKLVIPCPLVRSTSRGAFDDLSVAAHAANLADQGRREAGNGEEDAAAAAASAAIGRAGGAEGPAGAEAAPKKSRWFKENCEIIANRYLLSQRETEVLFLLAKGYNSTAIQEKLYIAEGTAKTHIRHIYRKLDVHAQQDLMRMVESADSPDTSL